MAASTDHFPSSAPLFITSVRYYNAGELPTLSILNVQPELVHRVILRFGYYQFIDTDSGRGAVHMIHTLYVKYWPGWR